MSEELSYKQKRRVEKIKKKKAKIDKLTEDMKKMVKLELKDGMLQPKLQPTGDAMPEKLVGEDLPPVPPPQMVEPAPPQPVVEQPNPFEDIPQQPVVSQPELPQQVPPQQFVQQPQMQQPQVPEVVSVYIRLVEGESVKVNVPGSQIDLMLKSLSEAIDNQSTFPIGTKVLNGRYIIFYTF